MLDLKDAYTCKNERYLYDISIVQWLVMAISQSWLMNLFDHYVESDNYLDSCNGCCTYTCHLDCFSIFFNPCPTEPRYTLPLQTV